MCNEAFEGWPFAKACQAIRKAGYTGIEIAPFTLAEKPGDITAAERREYRQVIQSEGLNFVGLHWLMVSPAGLHVSGPDAGLAPAKLGAYPRSDRSVRGPGGRRRDGLRLAQTAVHHGRTRARGSHAQLHRRPRRVAPHAAHRQVRVLVEALPANQSDVVETLEEKPSPWCARSAARTFRPCSTCTTPSTKPCRTRRWWSAGSTTFGTFT